ncbi:hypothetical protein B2J88_46940 [Rhodococcus sp. SRB_17]|nr:hypothetical protein [Rhodococcus sp. SRB_17]
MLHIIANPFTLTQFLLERLPRERQGHIHLHPARRRGVVYTVRKAIDAALPFRLAGLRSFSREYLQGLLDIAPHAPVLIFGIENIKDLRIIRKHLRTRRVSVFTWNPVIDHNQNHRARRLHIRLLKGLGFRVVTFDPADAAQYGLDLVPQVYRRVDAYRQCAAADVDVYFLGKDKGRFDALHRLGMQLQALGLRTDLLVVPERGREYPVQAEVVLCRQELSYRENIERINRARCLLEWTQANQTGLTIRTLEALFFDKKLITNNPRVKQQPFYHPARIFVLGHDDLGQIADFLAAPMPPIADATLAAHDFPLWIRQFESFSTT